MSRFVETSQSALARGVRLFTSLTVQGFIVPCYLQIKVIPSLSNGLRIAGFFRDARASILKEDDNHDKSFFILYRSEVNLKVVSEHYSHLFFFRVETQRICGVSETAYNKYGIYSRNLRIPEISLQ